MTDLPTPKVDRKRLRKLADFIETQVEDKWFNMRIIADQGFDLRECGTAACCLGWTPTCFPRSGIELVRVSEDRSYDGELMYELEVRYKGMEGFAAGAAFYGLTMKETGYLFEPSEYPFKNETRALDRQTVVDRIRKFCNGWVGPNRIRGVAVST